MKGLQGSGSDPEPSHLSSANVENEYIFLTHTRLQVACIKTTLIY
jgi:hypothetical protein